MTDESGNDRPPEPPPLLVERRERKSQVGRPATRYSLSPKSIWLTVAIAALALTAVGTYFIFRSPPPHAETAAYVQTVADPVSFLSGLRSYDGVERARSQITALGFHAERQSSHKLPSPDYPPRDLDTLEVYGFQHLKSRGRLRLEFFNDRLYQAQFEPEEPRQYLARLRATEPRLRRDRNGRAEFSVGALRMASNLDLAVSKVGRHLQTRPYVLWQDLRLQQQLVAWESRYGAVAARPR